MTSLATLDVGTNSVLLLVGEPDGRGGLRVIDDRSIITRLGEGLGATGEICRAAADRTASAIADLKRVARDLGVGQVRAVGTMCLRKAKNAGHFIERIERESSIRIQVIDGREEARLTYLGVRSRTDLADDRLVVFDLGGGSTEFVFGHGEEIEKSFSLDLGVVTSTERFLVSDPVALSQLEDLLQYLRKEALSVLAKSRPVETLIGVGGTVTTMAAVQLGLVSYDRDRVHGMRFSLARIDEQMRAFLRATKAEREAMPGMEPKRAEVILAGAAIVWTLTELLGATSFVVSDSGLRHGLLLEMASSGLAGKKTNL